MENNILGIVISVVVSGLFTFGAVAFVVSKFKSFLNDNMFKADAFLEKWVGDENSDQMYEKLQEMCMDLWKALEAMRKTDSFQESESGNEDSN